MLTKRNALLAAGAAVLMALSGRHVGRAADANWAYDTNGQTPFGAVQGGQDTDSSPLYFCRVHYLTGVQPGKLNPELGTYNFCYGGREIASATYDVLVPHWVSASGGQVPGGSYAPGFDSDGATLYSCRARLDQGGLQPGKLKQGAGCYIAYGGREILLPNYEVLQDDLPMIPTNSSKGFGWIVGGFEANNLALPLCLAVYPVNGDYTFQPGKIVADNLCHFSYGGQEMTAFNYSPIGVSDGSRPDAANFDFIVGNDTNGAHLYACTTVRRTGRPNWENTAETLTGNVILGTAGARKPAAI